MAASVNAHNDTQKVLIDAYEALLVHVTQMHELVNAEQWEDLIKQRTHYVMLVERLRGLDSTVLLDEAGRQRKAALLEDILEYDAEIRRRLVARRDELGKLIGVSQRQRDLHRAYAPQQGADSDGDDEAAT
ncbi:flagellar protein FliT [Vreelandella songnenensis]|uniref:Flagellar protein FliT n=1 Tax=Vreelandella songnenensis TaxID=1176243 RepID=A0A2T0V352_9GAMM|nr:flagellar protein FliT [Halomonas songnenensis]PRY64584.1 flagellar protein FliT [Halomonas songnenensis]